MKLSDTHLRLIGCFLMVLFFLTGFTVAVVGLPVAAYYACDLFAHLLLWLQWLGDWYNWWLPVR